MKTKLPYFNKTNFNLNAKSVLLSTLFIYPLLNVAKAAPVASNITQTSNKIDKNAISEEQNTENNSLTENDKIEVVTVTGRPIKNYSAIDSLTGTKTNALLKDLPLSVSVVPQALIKDRAISSLGESLDNVSGAQRKQGYGGTQNFGAFLRGFDSSFLTLRNGVRDAGFYTLRDTANVERFEVLKGPGSVLYGALQPGGITNTVTKKPTGDTFGRLNLSAGSHNSYRGEVDLSGKFNESTYFRLNSAVDDAGSFRDEVESNGHFISPVVSFHISDDLVWTVEAEHRHSEFTWDLGFPKHPLTLTLPIERFLGEPDGKNDVNSTALFSSVDYNINESWKFKQVTSYAKSDGDYKIRSPWQYDENEQAADRAAYDTKEESSTFAVINDFIGEFEANGIDHQMVIGFDHYKVKQAYHFDFLFLPPLDIYTPVYGAEAAPGFPLFADSTETKHYGVYIQDLMSIHEQWKLLVGARYDNVEYSKIDTLTGTLSRESKDNTISPQVGLVYQTNENLSWYISYSESFTPSLSGRTYDESEIKPQEGEQYEIGVKKSWLNNQLSTSLALFNITKTNVNSADPEHPNFIIQTGEQKSKGVELDINGEIIEGWDIIFGAAYTDAFVSKDNSSSLNSTLVGIPKVSANVWSKYTVQAEPFQKLAIGLGLYYADKRHVSLPNKEWTLPSYTRVDAMLSYPFKNIDIRLNINNLTDKKIYDLTSTSLFPQAPRSINFGISYSFM